MSNHTAITRMLIGLTALALSAGCASPPLPPGDPALAAARAALAAGEHRRAIELLAPLVGQNGEAHLLLARARAESARLQRATAPGDPASLRAALDQIALALPLAGGDLELYGELLAVQGELVALLATEDARRATEVLPSPVVAAAQTRPAAEESRPRLRPQPVTPAPSYNIVERKSFDGSANSGAFASCIDIQVLGPAGPVAGAVIGINNGEHSYQNQTDANGYTGRCGLGASTWSVVLFWTPGEGSARGIATTLYVNGAPEQRAAAVFQWR